DITALPITNASLLDEATAAAEAMHLTEAVAKLRAGATPRFLIAEGCHPQTIAVVRTRAEARGVETVIADPMAFEFRPGVIGALPPYPPPGGKVGDCRPVCTAQVLLAVMASMYAVYHGPEGLRRIAERVHTLTGLLASALTRLGYRVVHSTFFDTLCVEVESWPLPRLIDAARARRINLRTISPT